MIFNGNTWNSPYKYFFVCENFAHGSFHVFFYLLSGCPGFSFAYNIFLWKMLW